jgi:hypothetical protein
MSASVLSRQAHQGNSTVAQRSARAPSPHSASMGVPMNMTLSIGPIVSLIAGVLILIVPRLLNYIVAIYLILIGLIGLFGTGTLHLGTMHLR